MYDVNALFAALATVVEEDNYTYHHIRGNSKLGSIPAANVLPLVTCHESCMGTCGAEGCYAVKNALCHGYDLHKNNCLRAWAENTAMLIYRTEEYFAGISSDIAKYYKSCVKHNRECYIRVHASGDFYSVKALECWVNIAKTFPKVHFLAYTKQFEMLQKVDVPDNFSIVLSDWEGIKIPEKLKISYKTAYVGDTAPDCETCPGNCTNCKKCWHLKELNCNILFHKH